jgi:hypothetical protein
MKWMGYGLSQNGVENVVKPLAKRPGLRRRTWIHCDTRHGSRMEEGKSSVNCRRACYHVWPISVQSYMYNRSQASNPNTDVQNQTFNAAQAARPLAFQSLMAKRSSVSTGRIGWWLQSKYLTRECVWQTGEQKCVGGLGRKVSDGLQRRQGWEHKQMCDSRI